MTAAACCTFASGVSLRPWGATEGDNATTYTFFAGECRTVKDKAASSFKIKPCRGAACSKEGCQFTCSLDSECFAFEVNATTCKLHTDPVARGSGGSRSECHVKKQLAMYDKKACECLRWDQVYALGGLKCGAGLEYFSYSGGAGRHREPGPDQSYEDAELCHDVPGHPNTAVFLWQKHNYCVKKDVKGSYEEAWCYVSAECKELRGGSKVKGDFGEHFAYKECMSGQDELLSDRTPMQLAKMAQSDLTVPKYAWKMIANIAYSHLDGHAKEADPLGFELKLKAAANRDEPIKYLDDKGNLFAWKGKQGVAFGDSGWTICLRDCHSIVPLYTGDDQGWKEAQSLMTPMDWHAMTTG